MKSSIRKTINYLFIVITAIVLVVQGYSQSNRDAGIQAYRNSNYAEAIKALKLATDTDRKDKIAWVYYGAALFRNGQKRDAVSALKKGKAKIEDLVPGDDSPVSSVSKPRPRYTDMARKRSTVGTVRVAIEFLEDAKIGFILPIETLPDGLTEQSLAAAKSIKFKPAIKNGKPARTVAIVEYSFAIY